MRLREIRRILSIAIISPVFGDIEDEVPLGIEAMSGIRSGYTHRGFDLADTSLEFQFSGKVILKNGQNLTLGISQLAEVNDTFSETSSHLEWTSPASENLHFGVSATYRDRNHSTIASGFDLGVFTTYSIHPDWQWRNDLIYDWASQGLYGSTEIAWSYLTSNDSFITITSGLSLIANYEDLDGINDFYSRCSYHYGLSELVSVTPFLGASLLLDHKENRKSSVFGGLLFQVIF